MFINVRRLLVLTTAAAMVTLVVSCAARQAEPQEELVFWSAFAGGQPKVAMDRFVDEFNATHAHLGRVRKLDIGFADLEQKLLTTVAGNVPPDLVLFNRPNIAAFAFRGAFEPWDPWLDELELSGDHFFESCWNEGIWDGHVYSIPMNTDVRVLFYNRELFRRCGLNPDRPPRTWNELREMSRQLTIRDARGRLLQTGFVPVGGAYGNTYFPLFAYQLGDDLLDEQGKIRVNGPLARKAMQWIVDFVQDYGTQDLMLMQTASGADQLSLFLQGRAAMQGDEGYLLSLIERYQPEMDYGVAPLPWPEEGQPATWSGGFGFALPRGKTLTPLGSAFVRYLTSRPVQLDYGKIAAQIPALKSAASDPFFTNDAHWSVFVDQMQYTRSLPVSPLSLKMFNDLIRGTERAIHGAVSPGGALDWVQKELDAEWSLLTAYADFPQLSWRSMLTWVSAAAGALILLRLAISLWRSRHTRLRRGEIAWGYLMAAPAIVGLLGLALGPMAISALISLCAYDILNPPRLIGLENYARLIARDPLFWVSIWNTTVYILLSVPLGIATALALALLLNHPMPARSLWRAVFYLPSIFPIVAGSFLWLWLFNGEFGLINGILRLLHIDAVPWLTDPHLSKPALVIMSLWGVGMAIIVFLAALQGIPEHLYEAAKIDGATVPQQFLHVTLPMISPTIFFLSVIGVIGSFQVFTQAYLMTDGGPLDSTLFYVLYLFREAFEYFHMGYGAAMAWVLFLLIGVLTWTQFKLSHRFVTYDMG